ncbi:hypothetical protein O6H91_Y046700 [Diphasiastrum complanatum]|nr:hypothetical protein O6H91_Y046700 [Diphasiastrum complanatum]
MGNTSGRPAYSGANEGDKTTRPRTTLNDSLAEERKEQKLESPSVKITSMAFTSIDLERAHMDVEVEIHNPGKLGLNLVSMHILLDSDSRILLAAKQDHALSIVPNHVEFLKISLTIVYKNIQDRYPEIKPGQIIPYNLKLWPDYQKTLNVSKISIEKAGKLPFPLEPTVQLKKASIYEISMEQLSVRLQLKVENKNEFHFSVQKLDYNVVLSGEVVVSGSASPKTVARSNSFQLTDLPITFWPKNLLAALFTIARGRGSGLTVQWKLHAYTHFGPMQF